MNNKIFNSIIFTFFAIVLSFVSTSVVIAASLDSTLPDNVKITSSPDGNTTTVEINSKPGYTTNVQTNCVNGKCTHKATSSAITSADIKKIQDNMKKQEEAMTAFWKAQDEFFKQQQKMFQDLWGVNMF